MKKRAVYLLCVLFIMLSFIACQKQYTFKDGLTNMIDSSRGTATYSFIDSSRTCAGAIIRGNYTQGVTLDFSNTVQIKLQVDSLGSYIITTANINGMLFSGSGIFTKTGLQIITLTGAGKPLVSGAFDFIPGKNSCLFTINCMPAAVAANGCTACTYFPTCAGSTYLYMDTIITPNFIDTGSVVVVNSRQANFLTSTDTLINTLIFKKIAVSDGATINYNYINCINGQTRLISYGVPSATSGNTLTKIDLIELKANAVVGTSWTDTTTFNGINNFYRTSTIMQKGVSRTFINVTYNNVIKIKVVQTLGTAPAGIIEYYFAKGIGFIEQIAYNINPVTNDTYIGVHTVLKSYFIP